MRPRVLVNLFGGALFVPRTWITGAGILLFGLFAAFMSAAGPDGLVASGTIGALAIGMIMDELLEFADATSVAAAAGTALIGDVIDLGVAARDIGNGEQLYLVITVDTEIITGGSAGTLQFQLVSDAQAAIAVDGSATVHFASRLFVTDDAAANDAEMNAGGVPVCIALPMHGAVYEQFLGILAVTATTTTTAGKINAFLTKDPSRWKSYKNAANS